MYSPENEHLDRFHFSVWKASQQTRPIRVKQQVTRPISCGRASRPRPPCCLPRMRRSTPPSQHGPLALLLPARFGDLLTQGPFPVSSPLGVGPAFFPPPGRIRRAVPPVSPPVAGPGELRLLDLPRPDQQLPHSPASHAVPFAGAVMAFGRRSPGSSRHRPALTIVSALLLAFLSSAAAAAAASSSTDAMHNNNWAVLVCTSRFWSALFILLVVCSCLAGCGWGSNPVLSYSVGVTSAGFV